MNGYSTMQAALAVKVMTSTSLKRVVVDTTVQEKNIAFPTDNCCVNTIPDTVLRDFLTLFKAR